MTVGWNIKEQWQKIKINIVAYRPVARQRPWNKQETTDVAMQRPSKHVSKTIVINRNGVFYSVRAMGLSERQLGRPSQLRVVPYGGRVEYLYRSPTSRRRRWKGNPVPGGITRPPCSWGDINTGTWLCRLWESRVWGSKMWSCGTHTWEWLRWRGPAAIVNNRRILSSQRMLHKDYDLKCLFGK
jgi:hypothetical protein